jgi:hypothetical protein
MKSQRLGNNRHAEVFNEGGMMLRRMKKTPTRALRQKNFNCFFRYFVSA